MTRPSKLSEEEIFNGKEAIRKERELQGDCPFCPPNHNENARGSKSHWGRKVAKKTYYRTGKGRKEIDWHRDGRFWDLEDKHYYDWTKDNSRV